ncbi:hypothetical protein [Sporosarcina sp. OR05]|uniref:hypothetical protein n=1 Tax=Sporosarcina sp. OR05 TaxID=2969819 RepID=UPI00352B21E9
MSIANIVVEVDRSEIERQVSEKIDKALRDTLLVWDATEMSKRLCMGRTFLEEEILCDPRMRQLERRKGKGKRYWFYEPSLKVIQEIMDEW